MQTFNPYLPSYEYIADAEPYVFDERVYIYGSHDRFDGGDFCLNDYVCWSAPINDLGNWRNEGIIYKPTQDPLNTNTDGQQNGFAPDVNQGPDGRYYFYYALSRSPVISVAVCNTPAGEYQFYGHVHYRDGRIFGKNQGDVFNFDPGVLVDDDGRVYLYTGFSPISEFLRSMLKKNGLLIDGAYCVELEQDMLTIKSLPELVLPGESVSLETGFENHGFFEASSPRKINGKYYMIYSSIKSHELCYAVSDKPNGKFTYGGTIVSIGDVGLNGEEQAVNYTGNTHGGIVNIKHQWYVFYHRQTNGHQYSRQACAEKIEILLDGSIPQVEVTSCGLNHGPLMGTGEYEARIACNLSNVNGTYHYGKDKHKEQDHPYFTQSGLDRNENGDQYIANMQDGAWACYKYFDFNNENMITVTIKGTAKGVMKVFTKIGEEVSEIEIQSAEKWTQFPAVLKVPQGIHALYFQYKGSGSLDFLSFKLQ